MIQTAEHLAPTLNLATACDVLSVSLSNAILPLVTMMALDLPAVFAGALFVETIFSWPGMGRLFWDAANGRDYPVLLAVVMIDAVIILACNLLADLLYGVLDPRVRYE